MIFIHSAILYFSFKGMKHVVANDCDLLIFATAFVPIPKRPLEISYVPLMLTSLCMRFSRFFLYFTFNSPLKAAMRIFFESQNIQFLFKRIEKNVQFLCSND